MDLQTIVSMISGLLTGGVLTLAVTLGSQRRKAKASADRDEFDLQRELARDNAEKTLKIRELNAEVLNLTKERYELEQRHLSTRCDLTNCLSRRPPLPWLAGVCEERVTGDCGQVAGNKERNENYEEDR